MGLKKKTKEDFNRDVERKYGVGVYTILGDYVNNKEKLLVRHNVCGSEFAVRPDTFLRYTGSGCPACSGVKRYTPEEFEERFYKVFDANEYTILTPYKNSDSKIEVRHNTCGKSRSALPHRLLKGDRCSYCCGNMRKNISDFKVEVSEKTANNISCISDSYINNKEKLEFVCNKCGRHFFSRPNNILSGNGCPWCNKSKAESIIETVLVRHGVKYVREKSYPDLFGEFTTHKFKFDFQISLGSSEILLEFDGEQHFNQNNRLHSIENMKEIIKRDTAKNIYAINHNIPLMRIPFTEFKNLIPIIEKLISTTTIPDEFKVVGPSGSKSSAALYKKYGVDDIV